MFSFASLECWGYLTRRDAYPNSCLLKSNPWFPVLTNEAASSPEGRAGVRGGKRQLLSGTVTHTADKEAAETRNMLLFKQICSESKLILQAWILVVTSIKDIFFLSRGISAWDFLIHFLFFLQQD